METLAQRAVAYLIVVLQTNHESIRRDAGRIRCREVRPDASRTARIEPALTDRRGHVVGSTGVVAIVAFRVAREQPPALVVKVVGPRGIDAPAAVTLGLQHPIEVAMILGHDQDAPAGGPFADPRGQFGEEVTRAIVGDRMRGVEPKTVDVIFVHPMARVLDEEFAAPSRCARRRS